MEHGGEPNLNIFSLIFSTSHCNHAHPFICQAYLSSVLVEHQREPKFGIGRANFNPSMEDYEIKEGDIRIIFSWLKYKKYYSGLEENKCFFECNQKN